MKNNISFNSNLSKFGIGLFETIKIEKEPIDFDLHMNRLYNSVKELSLNFNINYAHRGNFSKNSYGYGVKNKSQPVSTHFATSIMTPRGNNH